MRQMTRNTAETDAAIERRTFTARELMPLRKEMTQTQTTCAVMIERIEALEHEILQLRANLAAA